MSSVVVDLRRVEATGESPRSKVGSDGLANRFFRFPRPPFPSQLSLPPSPPPLHPFTFPSPLPPYIRRLPKLRSPILYVLFQSYSVIKAIEDVCSPRRRRCRSSSSSSSSSVVKVFYRRPLTDNNLTTNRDHPIMYNPRYKYSNPSILAPKSSVLPPPNPRQRHHDPHPQC